ncbi:MAG: sigma-70 family RNA polymerase sigma factor [Planctomycetes bacterium]|nr:sigma-70 family RNA polymerase sigma factor [Planctomycetota bacterium]
METVAMDVAARQALTRLWRWRVPGNWSRPQWRDEISSEVALAVMELLRGTALEPPTDTHHLWSKIQNKVRRHYRQEWAFSKHFGCQMVAEPTDSNHLERELEYLAIHEALALLSESDRRLIQQLYWGKRTETQIAAEAGVSVPAICKRKNRILRHLQNVLKNFGDGRLIKWDQMEL